MSIQLHQTVMYPGYSPYPRYARVAEFLDSGEVRVTDVTCGDPRCAAEHRHGDQIWSLADLGAVTAYQPRAPWEHGRKSSPNAPVA